MHAIVYVVPVYSPLGGGAGADFQGGTNYFRDYLALVLKKHILLWSEHLLSKRCLFNSFLLQSECTLIWHDMTIVWQCNVASN